MAKYKLTVDLPTRPEGDPVEVPPFGIVPNGSTVEIETDASTASILGRAYGMSVSGKSNSKSKETPESTEEGGEE